MSPISGYTHNTFNVGLGLHVGFINNSKNNNKDFLFTFMTIIMRCRDVKKCVIMPTANCFHRDQFMLLTWNERETWSLIQLKNLSYAASMNK